MVNRTAFHDLNESPRLLDLYYGSFRRARAAIADRPDAETRHLTYTSKLWDSLGMRPGDAFPFITVAGSKGKGSTAALLASMLSASGAKVGLITSPHLLAFRERIRIDGTSITPLQLDAALDMIEPVVKEMTARIVSPHYLGPGGIVLALALPLFQAAGVTICVVEAGRGGEFDEARLLHAQVSVLTRIMLEHTAQLGATLPAIAATKARITFPGSPLIVAPQDDAVYATLAHVAEELGAPLMRVQDSLIVHHYSDDLPTMQCDITVAGKRYEQLAIGLQGRHQIENAATAITAAQALPARVAHLSEANIRTGLRRVQVPGRLQRLSQRPLVMVDGAINAASAHAACTVFSKYPCQRRFAVIAVPAAKDLAGVCQAVAPHVDAILLTEVPSPRLTWHADAGHIAERFHAKVEVHIPADVAFDHVLARANADDGILLLGTQTFTANALHYWGQDADTLW